jgi:hypothetical protein
MPGLVLRLMLRADINYQTREIGSDERIPI